MSGCITSQSEPGKSTKTNVSVVVIDGRGEIILEKSVEVAKGRYIISVMRGLTDIETTEYPGMGEFITSIAGIPSGETSYWGFYIDGEYAMVGASAYLIEEDVEIMWKLEDM